MRTRGLTPTRRHSAAAVLAFVALAAGLDGTMATGKAPTAAVTDSSQLHQQSARSTPRTASVKTAPTASGNLPIATQDPSPLDRWSPDRRSAGGAQAGFSTVSQSSRVIPGDEEKHDGETTPAITTPGGPASGGPAWTPPAPLPEAAADSRRVDVVLTPHPDDETLSLGVWIADAVEHRHRVIVVSITDGRSTGAITAVSTQLRRKVTRDEIGDARIRELRAASAALGVAPGDVYAARCDAEASYSGTRVTVSEARAVIEAFAARFPQATFATMSWMAERHADHLAVGEALRDAAETGVVQHSTFAISRLWWGLRAPYPVRDVRPVSVAVRRRVLAAAATYRVWDPRQKRYSIGWLSVRRQFNALLADPHDRVHAGPTPTKPGIEP